jgi:hypothetical protein
MRRTVLAAGPAECGATTQRAKAAHTYMKAAQAQAPTQEPIGIVISAGSNGEAAPVPRFAYIWAPPPQDEVVEEATV